MSDPEEVAFREMFPVVIAGLAGIAVLFLVAALFVASGDDTYVPADMTKEQAIGERIDPAGEVNMGGPKVAQASSSSGDSGASDEPRGGEAVYQAVCSSCHDNGTLGAPEIGDKAAWSDRVGKGMETLVDHSYNGFNQMPAQKSAASRDEIENAINYILDETGVSP
jgi:cytochrome c5